MIRPVRWKSVRAMELHGARDILQSVELAGAVLSRDVLPVGTAGQGHHGAEGHGALAHLHLKLGARLGLG